MIRDEEALAATGSTRQKRDHIAFLGRYELAAAVVIALGIAARFAIVVLGWPENDSDEGTIGLMAIHIAYRGAHPIFFYGQYYMGALEAYLGAASFHVFGISIVALRLGPLLLYLLFLVCTYLLAALLFDRRVALVSTALLSLGTGEMLFRQLEAAGGYSETLAFGSLCLLLAAWLALTHVPAASRPDTSTAAPSGSVRRRQWLRWAAYAAWGLSAGLGLWSDLLVLPFIVTSLTLLLICCRDELRSRALVFLALGLVIGAWPLIAYNLSAAPGQDSLSVFLRLDSSSGAQRSFVGLLAQLSGTLLVSLPAITGANPLCPLTSHAAWPLSAQSGGRVLACTGVHAAWGLGWLALGVLAALGAFWTLRRLVRRVPGGSWLALRVEPAENRRSAVLALSRLAVLVGAWLSLATYALSPTAALFPWQNARYLLGLLIATPVILSPLLGYAPFVRERRPPWPRMSAIARYAVLALVAAVLFVGMATIFVNVTPAAQAHNRTTRDLITRLETGGMTHIYTDYWTCDRVAFQSDERIVCGVLDERLRLGQNRYMPYLRIVQADPRSAYVFLASSPQAALMAQRAAQAPGHWARLDFDGYVAYQPVG